MKKMKENKGFTLVELIVVIVILAILAAILVPALLGYIDKAKGQQVVLNGKSVLTAAQADLSSAYAKGKAPQTVKDTDSIAKTADVEGVAALIEIKIGYSDASKASTEHGAYTVYGVKYQETGKDAIYYVYDYKTKTGSWDKDNETAYGSLKFADGKTCANIEIPVAPVSTGE